MQVEVQREEALMQIFIISICIAQINPSPALYLPERKLLFRGWNRKEKVCLLLLFNSSP